MCLLNHLWTIWSVWKIFLTQIIIVAIVKSWRIFFYTQQQDYKFPMVSGNNNNGFEIDDDIKQCEGLFTPKQPLKFETFVFY